MTCVLNSKIAAALETVCDPCSLAANAPLSVVDMGLVRSWTADTEGNVVIRMCVTSPCCTMAPNILRGATQALESLPGVRSVQVDIDASLAWSPDWMTERGKSMLAKRRAHALEVSGVQPQQWRSATRAERRPGT